jgi:hypothetical protein
MTKRFWILSVLAACAVGCLDAQASRPDVTVEIVGSDGATFQQVPAKRPAIRQGNTWRAYLEAERDARYRIRITNSTGRRVGVVVAVDGRNIISGARSELAKGEPMYVLDAWDMHEYSGWRANLSEVNEFYFTEWKDSYAEAFGDRSARGVIAVAVYREKEPERQWWSEAPRRAEPESAADADTSGNAAAAASGAAPPTVAQDSSAHRSRELAKKAERSDAGTGYGDRRIEHATRVAFEAESRATQQVFLKYEWREALCGKRILSCEDPPNRFWPERSYGFAPPPPTRR